MPVHPHDRPLDTLRAEIVDRLIVNYGHGQLSREAFERRLDEALDTQSHERLIDLTKDLELEADRTYTAHKKAELGVRVDPAAAASADDVEHIVNVFSGNSRKGAWDVPKAIRIVNVFGGVELDFTDARFTAQTTYITIFCLFGGVDVRVRDGMRTLSKAACLFGGVDNRAPSTTDANAPVLIIEGIALFGGLSVRVRKTPKQRLREFADQIRAMFDLEPPRA